MRAKTNIAELEFKILERHEDIKRLEENIKKQQEHIEKLESEGEE